MWSKTGNLRHVWRTVNDGNGEIKVLILQEEWKYYEGFFGEKDSDWRDVPIVTCE